MLTRYTLNGDISQGSSVFMCEGATLNGAISRESYVSMCEGCKFLESRFPVPVGESLSVTFSGSSAG